MAIKSNILPSNKFFEILESKFILQNENTDSLILFQPDLQFYVQKSNSLKLDIKLKQSYVLPKFDLKYQYLTTDLSQYSSINLANNHRLGLSFSAPLYFRSSRGELKTAKLKLLENEFETTLKQREIDTKLLALKKQTLAYKEILDMLKNLDTGYYKL
jgi:outer membrane protein TolC